MVSTFLMGYTKPTKRLLRVEHRRDGGELQPRRDENAGRHFWYTVAMKCLIKKDDKFIHTQLCGRQGLWSSWEKDAKVFANIGSAEQFASENELTDYEIVPSHNSGHGADIVTEGDADS